MSASPTVLQRLAAYAAEVAQAPLPSAVVHAAKRCVLDWFACVLAGGLVAPATALKKALAADGVGGAFLYPDGTRASPRTAALINGAASHTIEFDDIFREAVYHPGVVVIPAALALAQARGLAGEAFLRAVVAGYEVSTRIGIAVTPAHYRFWHTTGTVGCFGAAAGAGAALGLGPEAMTHALANAGTLAAGLQQAFRADAMSKPLHAGHAAETGVWVAQAAAEGVTGAPDLLEGARGFGAAMAEAPDWDGALADLGRAYNIARMTQKNHSACGHAHAAVDAAIGLARDHGLGGDEIARVRVATYGTAIEVAGQRDPQTEFEAKFSIPYCVAVAICDRRVRLGAFTPARRADPKLRALMGRVELAVDPVLDRQFPGRRAATVTIETADGRRLERHAPTRKGDPDAPLDDAELADKYLELAAPAVGESPARALMGRILALETLSDVRALVASAEPKRRVAS